MSALSTKMVSVEFADLESTLIQLLEERRPLNLVRMHCPGVLVNRDLEVRRIRQEPLISCETSVFHDLSRGVMALHYLFLVSARYHARIIV
jgi:hypothetical protein